MRIIHLHGDTPPPPPPYDGVIDSHERRSAGRRRVLVVDDERLIADTVAQILNIHGYDAFASYTGPEALKMAESFLPHFLLSDVMMPGMNGIDLAEEVKKVLPAVKVLLFSGQAGTGQLVERSGLRFALEAKPIHPEKLLKVLARLDGDKR